MEEFQRRLCRRRGLQERREDDPDSLISDFRLLVERVIGINSRRSACFLVPWYSHTNFFFPCPSEFTFNYNDYLKQRKEVKKIDFFTNFFRS